jgi:FG-GAP-like repeat/Beta-propeller repeat
MTKRLSLAQPAKRFALRALPLLVGAALCAGSASLPTPRIAGPALLSDFGPYPISFEPNRGQLAPGVLYRARGVRSDVTVRSGEIDVRLAGDDFRIRFAGANPAAEAQEVGASRTVSRYYIGSQTYGGTEGIHHAGQVRFRQLYPGVDLLLHGNQSRLEYDFEIAPGADPGKIRYDLTQADTISLDADGDLLVTSRGRTLRQHAPVAWQDVGTERMPIAARFKVAPGAHEVGFELGPYDVSRSLVIDPILDYSTYLGSSGNEYLGYMAVDSSGDIYLAGSEGVTPYGAGTISLTKYDPVSNEVLFTTVVGGALTQDAFAIALGSSGGVESVYVAGMTDSYDFPHCLRPAANDCASYHGYWDAFVLQVDTSGVLRTSWLLGGSGNDFANGIAADAAGSIYVVGDTDGDFATTPDALFHRAPGASHSDAFVVRLDAAKGVVYSTILGGSGDDFGYAIATDPSGNMHVAGETRSSDFLNLGASGGPGAFYVKISHDGHAVLSSSVLGSVYDAATAVAADADGYAVIAGYTENAAFPQSGSPRAFGGAVDAFVTRFGPNAFSTLLGGADYEYAYSVAFDSSGGVLVGGQTWSSNFPLISPLPPDMRGPAPGDHSHGFVARVSASGVSFSTTLGGSGDDSILTVLPSGPNGVLVAGVTSSGNFPTVDAFRTTLSGAGDLFLSRIVLDSSVGSSATPFDFDASHTSDLLWANDDGQAAIWLMNGVAPTSSAGIIGAGSGWSVKNVADFDGNGKGDLVWQHTDGSAAIWLMNGVSAASSALILGGGSGWSVVQTPDLNGDGKADILWQHTDGSTAAWLMNGTTMTSSALFIGAGTGWSVTKVADFDGDGNDDLLWTHTDGRVALWLMNGTTMKSSALLLGAGTGWSVRHTADLNGDGRADIIWQHTDGSVAVWLMNGTSATSSALLLGGGSGWSVAKVADFNGDGKSDLVWSHTDGSVAIWLMNGTAMASSAGLIGGGSGWSVKRTADFNGDGKADIVWQHTDGSTAVWLMNGTAATSSALLLGGGSGWSVSGASQ